MILINAKSSSGNPAQRTCPKALVVREDHPGKPGPFVLRVKDFSKPIVAPHTFVTAYNLSA